MQRKDAILDRAAREIPAMPHPRENLIESELTRAIIGAFYDVYAELGFGFLERIYSLALECLLVDRGHRVDREAAIPVYFRGRKLADQRVDMIVEGKVVVECKSSARLPAFAERQLLNYLRATDIQVGMLLHFGPSPQFYRAVSSQRSTRSKDRDADEGGHERTTAE